MEAVYSFLASRIVNGVQLDDIPGLSLTPDAASAVSEAVRASLTQVRLPPTLLSRHAGISPLLMQALLERMAVEPVDSLLLAPPEDRGAWAAYANAFRLLRETTGADFGVPARQNQLAVLVVQWMKGLPLARLVQDRLDYQARLPKPKAVPATIRSVMDDVENIARSLAPKYLACYRDVLGQHLANIGREDLAASVPEDIEMLLELGVSTRSELSLLELGLSRTSAVELFALMAEDALTPSGAVDWLSAQDLSQLDVPELVRREIERLLRSRPR